MHVRELVFFLCFGSLSPLVAGLSRSDQQTEVSANAVIREINLARQDPGLYAEFVCELRSRTQGDYLILPEGTRLRTKEGTGALDDAVEFLRSVQPQSALFVSPGLSRAAADHCADQALGRTGHSGSDASDPARRIERYGIWGVRWAENISYGKNSAREIVLALIIDDGLRGRKHRKNIFNPVFNYAGAAYGPHSRYRSVCNIDFAGIFIERGEASTATARPKYLTARSRIRD